MRRAVPDTFFERLSKLEMNELASINSFESSAFELLLFFLVVALFFFASLLQRVSQKMSNDNSNFSASMHRIFGDIFQRHDAKI